MESAPRVADLTEAFDVRCRVRPSKRPGLYGALVGEKQSVALMDFAELGVALSKLGINLQQAGNEKRPFIYLDGELVSLERVIRAFVAVQGGVHVPQRVATPIAAVVEGAPGALVAKSAEEHAGEMKSHSRSALAPVENPGKSSPGNTGSGDSRVGAAGEEPRREQVKPVEHRGEGSPGNRPPANDSPSIEDAKPAASSNAKSAAVAALWEDAMLK